MLETFPAVKIASSSTTQHIFRSGGRNRNLLLYRIPKLVEEKAWLLRPLLTDLLGSLLTGLRRLSRITLHMPSL